MKKMRERLVVKKVARWSVIINAVQILLMLGIAITVMLATAWSYQITMCAPCW